MLSQRARYALRALIYMNGRGEPVSTAEIAREVPVPRKFLEQILLQLKAHRMVESRRGREGGYRLGRSGAEISFADRVAVERIVTNSAGKNYGLRTLLVEVVQSELFNQK